MSGDDGEGKGKCKSVRCVNKKMTKAKSKKDTVALSNKGVPSLHACVSPRSWFVIFIAFLVRYFVVCL